MAAPTIDELTAGIHRLSDDMHKSRESATGMVDQFKNLVNTLVPLGVATKFLSTLLGGVVSQYAFAARSIVTSGHELRQQRMSELEKLRTMRAEVATGEISLRQYRDARFLYAVNRDVFKAQSQLVREIEIAGRRTLGIAALLAGTAIKTLDTTVQYNEALLQANTTFFRRLELMQAMGRVQVATGTAQATLVNSTRALVRYGLENKSSFEANLKTVVMLHDAVGLTAEESAHLAAVTENYAKASFQEVADVVATIVDQTALAASEVKNLGVELQRALGVITPGQTNLPQVVQALGGYEAALKEVTGRVGSFQKLVTNLATPEGMMQAGMLGVTPEMIKTKEGIDLIMRRFEGLVDRVVGNSEGLNRVWRLDTVAKMMNLSREEVSEMVRAMELKRGMDIKDLTLQEMYTRQVGNLNQGVSRLVNSLMSLLQQGLYPFVRVVAGATNWLALLIQKMADWKYSFYVAVGVVGISIVVVVNRLKAATRAFLELAAAAQIATVNIRARAMAELASKGVSGASGASGGWISRSLLWLATPFTKAWGGIAEIGRQISSFVGIYKMGFTSFGQTLVSISRIVVSGFAGLTAGVAIVGAVVGYRLYQLWRINKDSADETARVNRLLATRSQSLEQKRLDLAYMNMRSGNAENAVKQIQLAASTAGTDALNLGKSPEEVRQAIEDAYSKGRDLLTRAKYTEAVMSQKFGEGKADLTQWDAEMLDAMDRTAIAAEATRKNAERDIQAAKEAAMEDEKARDNAWLRFKQEVIVNRPKNPDAAANWGSWPITLKQ